MYNEPENLESAVRYLNTAQPFTRHYVEADNPYTYFVLANGAEIIVYGESFGEILADYVEHMLRVIGT